jgi:hypothetical protein
MELRGDYSVNGDNSVNDAERPFMSNFSFETKLAAVVRVRAADEIVARKLVPTVLGAPGTLEIRLANENNAVFFKDAIIIDVEFSLDEGAIKLIETDGVPAPAPAIRPPRPRASHRSSKLGDSQLRAGQSKRGVKKASPQ